MKTYNRQELKANGQDVETVKSCSPCAYCEIKPNEEVCRKCTQSGNYSEFEGMEVVFINKLETIL